MTNNSRTAVRIGLKAFISAFLIILALMVVSGVLTLIIEPGTYDRDSSQGREIVIPGSFKYTGTADYPVWRWFTAPVEVLFAKGNIIVITLIIFLIFVGGSFAILDRGNIIKSILSGIVKKFRNNKYQLMGIIIFFFMFSGAVLGIFEAMVPLVIFIVPLAHTLGWDSLTGLGMSLLPLAFGFAAAITNPFTIGVAQEIAELPVFSGAGLRTVFFIIVYVIVFLYVRSYAKKIEKNPGHSIVYEEDHSVREMLSRENPALESGVSDPVKMNRAIIWFSACIGSAVIFILISSQFPKISSLAFPIVGILFFIAGVGAGLFAGMGFAGVMKAFWDGLTGILPGVLLILMALSVKHIISNGGIMDTILYSASEYISHSSKYTAAFLVFALTMGMNFFIGSASAKAFLMMPILTPLADLVGITRQVAVVAFDLGDGFSNMLYPSNALLMIALGFTVVSYPKWIKWTIKLQIIIFGVSMAFLMFVTAIDFGPF